MNIYIYIYINFVPWHSEHLLLHYDRPSSTNIPPLIADKHIGQPTKHKTTSDTFICQRTQNPVLIPYNILVVPHPQVVGEAPG